MTIKKQFRVPIEQLTVQISWSQDWSSKRFVVYRSSHPPWGNKSCFNPTVIPYTHLTNQPTGNRDKNKKQIEYYMENNEGHCITVTEHYRYKCRKQEMISIYSM